MLRRSLLFGLGVCCLLLAVVGVVLPLLPTTPFVLLAAVCFSRSSSRFHRLLLNQRLFGPLIRGWEQYGMIPLRIKYLASGMMMIMGSYTLFFKQLPLWVDLSGAVVVFAGMLYIWSRPSTGA